MIAMNPALKRILYNLAYSHFALFAVNALCFGIALIFVDFTGYWEWGYKSFGFVVNGERVGIPYNTATAKVLIAVLFVTLTLKDHKAFRQTT